MDSVELQCMICPQQPTFSDQSHLLTHIGSKGHLSHYFNIQVRATKDADARQRLQDYDQWYCHSRIGQLLAHRLEMKETKQRRRREDRSMPPLKLEKLESDPHRYSVSHMDYPPIEFPLPEECCIDPSLGNLGSYPAEEAPTQRELNRLPEPDTEEQPAAFLFQKQHFNAKVVEAPVFNTRVPWRGHAESLSCRSNDETSTISDRSFYGHGLLENKLEDRVRKGQDMMPLTVSDSISVTHSRHTSITPSSIEQDGIFDSNRLKGVVWPGMDLFDTASEESKRRRNQKKDRAAFLQLVKDSQSIEPTEVIYFYPSWEMKKSRYISGNVESSPPRNLTPPVTKAPRKPKRRALEELEPNLPLTSRKTRTKGQRKKRNLNSESRKVLHESDDEIIDLMKPWSTFENKNARHFQVFRDSENQNEGTVNGTGHNSAHPMETFQSKFEEKSQDSPLSLESTFQAAHNAQHNTLDAHSALRLSTPEVHDGMWVEQAYPTSPLAHFNSDGFDMNLPQLITPQRVLLRPGHDYGHGFDAPECLRGSWKASGRPLLTGTSPAALSFTDALAQNSKCSPLKMKVERQSPLRSLPRPIITNEFGGTSGDETTDLGLGFMIPSPSFL